MNDIGKYTKKCSIDIVKLLAAKFSCLEINEKYFNKDNKLKILKILGKNEF